jgi:putative MATE family efflux protein
MSETSTRTVFIRRDVINDILGLAWPAILEQIAAMFGMMIVTSLLGRQSTNMLAVVGLTNMIVGILTTAFGGLATGSMVIVARLTGMNEGRQARNALFQSLLMGLTIALAAATLGYVTAGPALRLFFGDIGDLMALAAVYYKFSLISLPFLTLDFTIAFSMRGAGDTRTPMIITALGSGVQILLCLLLIGPLGIVGAGIALLASRVFNAMARLLTLVLLRRRLYLSFQEHYRLDFSLMKRIMRQGLPSFGEQLVMQGGFLAGNEILIGLGTAVLATWQVGTTINSLAFMPIFGLAAATATCVGQALGARSTERAANYSTHALRLGVVVITILGVLMAVFAEPLANLFSTDPQVIKNGIVLIRFFAVCEPLLAVLNIGASTLRAGGDVVYVMLTSLIGLWVFRVGLSLLLVSLAGLGLTGIMIGTGCDFLVRTFLYLIRIRQGHWKHKTV